MLERRSALFCADSRAARRESPPLRIGEVRGFALVQAAAFADTVVALGRAVRTAIGVQLPERLDTPRHAGGLCVFKVGPGQFWIVGPDDSPAMPMATAGSRSQGASVARLDERPRPFGAGPEQVRSAGGQNTWATSLGHAVPSAIGSLTSLSHGRTRLFVDGPAAREVLSKGIALDLHPEVFRCDAYALTGLQDTPVLLHRTGAQRYELYVLRTYAGWIWEWLTDAALPFGYDVVETSHASMQG